MHPSANDEPPFSTTCVTECVLFSCFLQFLTRVVRYFIRHTNGAKSLNTSTCSCVYIAYVHSFNFLNDHSLSVSGHRLVVSDPQNNLQYHNYQLLMLHQNMYLFIILGPCNCLLILIDSTQDANIQTTRHRFGEEG